MNTPAQLKYTKTDEWFDPASGGMGLTDYAQSQLSDIVFIEILVDVGDQVEAGKPIASVESGGRASAQVARTEPVWSMKSQCKPRGLSCLRTTKRVMLPATAQRRRSSPRRPSAAEGPDW